MADKRTVRLEADIYIDQDPYTMCRELDAELRKSDPGLDLFCGGFERVEIKTSTGTARRWRCWVEGRAK